MTFCRGVRGATTADDNTPEAILEATRQLLALMIRQNGIGADDVAAAFFTTSPDLNAEFPALAGRQLGWMNVAMLCGHELDVPRSLRRCIRILILWNTDKKSDEIVHVYVKGAERLRPDLSSLPPVDWGELESWIEGHLNREAKPSGRELGTALPCESVSSTMKAPDARNPASTAENNSIGGIVTPPTKKPDQFR